MNCKWMFQLTLVLGALVCVWGCDDGTGTATVEKDDHGHGEEGHHHEPETLAEAVTELTEMRDTIRDAFAKNDDDAAHDPLHEIGHLLTEMPELVDKESFSAETKTAIKASIETLVTSYAAVDKTMHGGEGSTYKEESDKIDAALKAIVDAMAAPAAATDGAAVPAAEGAAEPAAEATTTPEAAGTPAADSAKEGSGT